MKKQNGITLIALVISIIVMLILAGVSINAVVGDNGVLSKAQDTTFLNSCAYLEEYFQQLYATCAIDGNIDGQTPLEVIVNNGYGNYFFSTSDGYCLKRSIKNEETGVYDNLVFYLVKKDQLPTEVKNQLQGGNANKKLDFRKLNDVYGITSDLKAYYLEDGVDTILGLERTELNADSPDIVAFEPSSTLAQMVNGGTEAITNQGLKSIKSLTIDSTAELEVLKEFSQFTSLTNVYFQNLTIPSLAGMEGATSINYVKFTNCSVGDYSALSGLSNLTYLYLVKPTGKNTDVATLCSSDKGIANAEFSKLQYFGIVGDPYYLQKSQKEYNTGRYDLTDVSGLANFTDVTKKAIKYLYLQNNQLSSIASVRDFSNVLVLRLESNALTTLEGIENMSKLQILIAPIQYSSTEKIHTLGANEVTTEARTTDALSYIYKNADNKNTTLKLLQLNDNRNLKHIEYLNGCTKITSLYLNNANSLINVNQIASVIANCGTDYTIPGKYASDTISNTAKSLYLSGTLTVSKFEELMNNTNLTHLSLNGLTIKTDAGTTLTTTTSPTYDEEVTKVLSTCTSLQRLQLYNLGYLRTLGFIGSGKVTNLVELDLRSTKNVNDLTVLNTYATKLGILAINNDNIDLTTIQTTIERCKSTDSYYLGNSVGGAFLGTWNLMKQLENCTELTYFRDWVNYNARGEGLDSDGNPKVLDLRNTKIKEFYPRHWHDVKIYLPNTIERYNDIETELPVFSENSDKLTFLYISTCRNRSTTEEFTAFLENIGNNCPNLQTLKISMAKNLDLMDLSYLSNLQNLTELHIIGSTSEPQYTENRTSIAGVGNLSHLKTFYVNAHGNLWDVSDLARCTELENITITGTNVSNISFVKSMPNLKKLIMNTNAVKDIYPILSCKKLEEVNFQNNLLTDVGYHNSGSGSMAYDTLDVFYSLNQHVEAEETLDGVSGSLKTVKLKGNSFTDTDIIKSVEWDTALDI